MKGEPMCDVCDRRTGTFRCAAFPNGIPHPILLSEHDHREPYQGDRGLRFQPVDDPQLVAAVLAGYDGSASPPHDPADLSSPLA